jgi:hypothetical protein
MSRSFGHLFAILALVFGVFHSKTALAQNFHNLDQSCFYVANKFNTDNSILRVQQTSDQSLEKVNAINHFAGLGGRVSMEDVIRLSDFSKPKKNQNKFDLSSCLANPFASGAQNSCCVESSCEFESLFADCLSHSYPVADSPSRGFMQPSFTFSASNLPADICFLNAGHSGFQPAEPSNLTPKAVPAVDRHCERSAFWPIQKRWADAWLKLVSKWDSLQKKSHAEFLRSLPYGPKEHRADPLLLSNLFENKTQSTIDGMSGGSKSLDSQRSEPMDQGSNDYWAYYEGLDSFDMDPETRSIIDGLVSRFQVCRWLLGEAKSLTHRATHQSKIVLIDSYGEYLQGLDRFHHFMLPIVKTHNSVAKKEMVKPSDDKQWGWQDYRDLAVGYYYIFQNLADSPFFHDPHCWLHQKRADIEISLCGTPWLPVWYKLEQAFMKELANVEKQQQSEVQQIRTVASTLYWLGESLQKVSLNLAEIADSKEAGIASQFKTTQFK